MKKNLFKILLAVVLAGGVTIYVTTPEQPHHYEMHVVSYGETMESIIRDFNKNATANYDIRDAVATAVAESKKMEGGATSRQLNVGNKIAVPIYR